MNGLYFFLAILGVVLRLLCNLFDGMVAVEGGMRGKSGEVFNDLPDRFSDLFILVPLGYYLPYAFGGELGWIAGIFSVLTAYVRVLGGSVGLEQTFSGPMAKPQRMFFVIIALAASIILSYWNLQKYAILGVLVIIILGSFITFIRRTYHVISGLEKTEG